jgi:glycosyltransferase involved in cell wall biosynthesis
MVPDVASTIQLERAGTALTVGLVGCVVAGVETLFENACRAVDRQGSMRSLAVPVRPYQPGDAIERALWFMPSSLQGTLRSVLDTGPLFGARHLDVVWTQVDLPLLPWMLTANALRRVPVIYSADSTPRQMRQFGAHYGYWGGRSRAKASARDWLHGICLRRATLVTALTEWAARSMKNDYGLCAERIKVQPPGVDTSFWVPWPHPRRGRPRAIFVGGDFLRKGGDLLLEVFRARFKRSLGLDLVTRDCVLAEEGVRVHTDLKPNDPRLLQLYQEADLLVLPTRADCFSIAALEAMACGLPVVTCPVGGVGELLEDGHQGLYVPPDDAAALAGAMEALISDPGRRMAMGAAARALVEARYDAQKNYGRLVSLLEEVRSAH